MVIVVTTGMLLLECKQLITVPWSKFINYSYSNQLKMMVRDIDVHIETQLSVG